MAETIKGINVVIGAETTGLSKALGDVDKKASKIQSELKQVERLLRFDPSNTTLLAQKQQLLSQAIENTSEKLNRLRSVQQQVNEQFKRGEISEGQYRAFQREIEQTEGRLRSLQSRLEETNNAINKHTTTWGKLQEKLSTAGNNLRNIGQRMQDVGQSMAASFGAATTAIGGALGFAVKKSMDFEAQIDRVGAVAGATPAEIKKLEKAALDLGASTSKSATEVAQGMEIMAAMGYNTNQILAAMPGIIAAAEASGEDMALVADTVSAALNSFGLEASEAARVADVLAQAANDSAAGIQDMQYTFKYAAPVARTLGISLEQLAAATEIMANAGIRGEQAGTTLRAALIRLSDPPKEAAAMLKELGVRITDSSGKMLPFNQIIAQLSKSTERMSNAQKLAALSTIFGTEAASGMLTVIEAGPEKLDELTKSLQNSAGASQEAAQKMKDNLKGSLEELQGAFETAQVTIGNALAPAIEKVAGYIQNLINWFNNLSPSIQQFIVNAAAVSAVLAGIGTAIGVMLTIAGGAINGIGALAMAFGKVAKIISDTGGTIGLFSKTLGFITNPAGIAVAAIAGLGVGAAALVNHFKQSSIEVDLFGDKVSEATQEAVGGFLKLNDQATVALNQLDWSGQVVTQNIANNIVSTFDQMGDQVLAAMQQDHQAQLTQMQNFFAQSSALTEQEKQEALAKLQQHQQQEQQTIQQGQQRIAEILNAAKEQKRAITDAERQEINQIQQQMVETGIQYLSQNELEAKSILERMKAQAGELTAQQAAEVVQNSIKQRDEAIKAAEEQYNDVVKNIIRQRDEIGSITADQADKLIAEAKRQRDEAVKQAEEMHNKVVEEAKKQANEHVNQVDWETGQVLSKWEAFKNDMQSKWETIKTNTKNKLIEMSNNIRNKYEEMKNTASDKFEGMKNAISEKMTTAKMKIEEIWNQAQSFLEDIDLFEIGKDIIQGLINGIKSLASSVSNAAKDIASRITGGLKNALKISSPSRVMMQLGEYTGEGFALGLERTIDAVRRETAEMAAVVTGGLGGLSTPGVSVAGGVGAAAAAGSTINMDGLFAGATIIVRSDDDIRQLAREIWGMAQQAQRGLGGARV